MTDKKEIKNEPFPYDGHVYQQGPGAYRAFDSSAIQQTHQLFPSDEFNSGPIFMTLPNLGAAPMPSSLDEPDVFRSVTGMQEQTGYWASANQGTQGTQGKELFGTSHWNVRPVPMPVPEPKKLDALSNLVPRLASLNLSAPQPEIPELPEYVERFSSFVSTEAPTAVFGAILGYFGQAKVDYECESQRKLKMTGIAYENGTPVTFKVKIFRHKRDSNRCVVEFQRRSGCVVAFTSFYRRTLQALGSMVQCLYADDLASIKQQTSGAASNLIVPSMSFSGATTAASGPGQIVLDDNSVQNLLDMCLTESADVKREALRVLANASGLETNQQVLTSVIKIKSGQSIDIPARVVEVITSSLPSADREIGRCASLLLANLSQASVTFRGRLLPLIATFFTVLQRLAEPAATTVGGLLNKEIKRQVSKTLLLVSQSNLRDLKAPSSLSARRELLQHLSKDTDPQVKLNVVATLQAMADTKSGRNF